MFYDPVTSNYSTVMKFFEHIQIGEPNSHIDHFVTYIRGIKFTFSADIIATTLDLRPHQKHQIIQYPFAYKVLGRMKDCML